MVDDRLQRLRTELDDHSRIADHLGLDLERPLRSLDDGYPENAVALIGKLTEKLSASPFPMTPTVFTGFTSA